MSLRTSRSLWQLPTAALIGLPVLYVAGFGPACWLWHREWISYETMKFVAWPIAMSIRHVPEHLADALFRWVNLGGVSDLELYFLLVDASR